MQRPLFNKNSDIAIVMDFDGTLTQTDVVDGIVQNFSSDNAWIKIERDWAEGHISSDECMSRQLERVRVTRKELDQYIKTIELDPGFLDLKECAEHAGIPLVVLSDGFDLLIQKVLKFHKIESLKFVANHLTHRGKRLYPTFPHRSQREHYVCKQCAHCKRITLKENRDTVQHIVFIGDGMSDRCVVDVCDTVFAKDKLAKFCEDSQKDYYEYNTLFDVQERLSGVFTRFESPLLQEV